MFRKHGAKLQPGSGNKSYAPGDVSLGASEAILFDGKETIHASITVELEWLAKIRREAKDAGRHKPCIVLGFLSAKPPVPSEWAVIPLEYLEELYSAATGKKLKVERERTRRRRS